MDQLLTRAEVARLLRCCGKTVDRYRRMDGLPVVRIGAKVMFKPSAISKWIDERAERPRFREPAPMPVEVMPDTAPMPFFDVESSS